MRSKDVLIPILGPLSEAVTVVPYVAPVETVDESGFDNMEDMSTSVFQVRRVSSGSSNSMSMV